MITILTIALLLLCVLVLVNLAGLVWGCVLALRHPRHRYTFLAACLALGLAGNAWYQDWRQRFLLSVVPDALQVDSISYVQEESWGFGPGGNETGIRVYPLDAAVAARIRARGMDFFDAMPANAGQAGRSRSRLRGVYSAWHPTPIDDRIRSVPDTIPQPFSLRAYHNQFGFGIPVDPAIHAQVDRIMQTPGSYYAHGRSGILVVSPAQRVVVYLFSG